MYFTFIVIININNNIVFNTVHVYRTKNYNYTENVLNCLNKSAYQGSEIIYCR